MSCAATRQGDEFYCSRCRSRWDADGPQPTPCAPAAERRKAPIVTPSGVFDARAMVHKHRGWITSHSVLERMEIVARLAYEAGRRDGKK